MPGGNTPSVSSSGHDVTLSWAASVLAGSPSNVDVAGYTITRYQGGAAQAATGGCAGTVAALTCIETAVPSGTWTYTITPHQGSWTGAESAPSSSITIGSPSLSLSPTSVANSGTGTTTATVSDFLSSEGVTFYLDSNAPASQLGTATAGSGGGASATLTIPASASVGPHNILAVGAGGSSAQATLTVTSSAPEDTTPPGAPTGLNLAAGQDTGSSSSDGITKINTPQFTGFAEPNSTITLYNGAMAVGTGTTNGSGTFTATISPALADGTYTITARATDAANNTGPASAGKTITVDTTAPTGLTFTSCAFGSGSNYSCSGTYGTAANDGTALSLSLYLASSNSLTDGPLAFNGSAGTWTKGNSGPGKATYFAKVTQTDLAGNATTVQSANFTRS
jgi:hypothetical protein